MRKAFSDIFSAVAGVTVAVLLIVSAVLCGTALGAFQKSETDRLAAMVESVSVRDAAVLDAVKLVSGADGVFGYSADGELVFVRGYFTLPEYISPEVLRSGVSLTELNSPQLSTFEGNFSEAAFWAAADTKDGFIIVAEKNDAYYDFSAVIITVTVLAALFGICAIFVVVFFVAKRFISPIEEMTVKVAAFERGDFSERIAVSGDSEIGFLADSLNRMASTIEQTESDRKAFIANVSHELRTPMTTISGFLDGIIDGTISEGETERYLSLVSTETKRLSRLVTNMLSLSAFDAGTMRIAKIKFDILPVFLRILMQFRDEINRKNITVSAGESTEFIVNADEDLIGQVIYNLIENAVKFTEEGGEITISFSETDSDAAFRIRNTGGGLRAEEITKVFERFYKADTSRGKDKYGAGLGLSIVSNIIKLHSGKLIARSEAEKFTEFEIVLPNN